MAKTRGTWGTECKKGRARQTIVKFDGRGRVGELMRERYEVSGEASPRGAAKLVLTEERSRSCSLNTKRYKDSRMAVQSAMQPAVNYRVAHAFGLNSLVR
jgi:hypothetical protein